MIVKTSDNALSWPPLSADEDDDGVGAVNTFVGRGNVEMAMVDVVVPL